MDHLAEISTDRATNQAAKPSLHRWKSSYWLTRRPKYSYRFVESANIHSLVPDELTLLRMNESD